MPAYQTLVLNLIREFPLVHYPLKEQKILKETMEKEARNLEARHQALRDHLSRTKPEIDQMQLGSAALELALEEFQTRLASGLQPEDQETLSLDAAIAYLRKVTPPA